MTPAQKSGFKRWARSMSLLLRSLEVIVTFKEDLIPSSSVWKLNISTSEENLACFDNFLLEKLAILEWTLQKFAGI